MKKLASSALLLAAGALASLALIRPAQAEEQAMPPSVTLSDYVEIDKTQGYWLVGKGSEVTLVKRAGDEIKRVDNEIIP